MIIHLDAKAGQTVEEFATELCWIADRLDAIVLGKINGTGVEAIPGSVPSDLVRLYHASSAGFNTNAEVCQR